ncbi:MAG: hypothetical protein FWD56_07900, partial [Bacteroidales bacterium]|nr:hypothetical protein [Bacteroidales bacterium]
MKKALTLLALFLIIGIKMFGQDRITVSSKEDINELLTSKYLFPEFETSRVLLKNETIEAKMNYNALTGQMEYIDQSGKILVLKNKVQAIVLQGLFFKQSTKGYLEVIADGY